MLRVTGRILLIHSHEIVTRSNDKFEVMGKLIKELSKYRKGDKIAVWFYIDAKSNNKKWYNTLRAVEIEKPNVIQKQKQEYELNFTEYDE